MPADQWLKLHTSLLLSSKFTSLPNNDCRWAFICLMMLCKKGVITRNMTWNRSQTRSLLGHLALTSRRWKVVKHVLFEAGLITKDFWVVGFEDSQIRPSALRKRRQRERDSHTNVTSNVTTEERGEKKDKNKVVFNFPKTTPKKRKSVSYKEPARVVLDHLNEKVGKAFTATHDIEARLKDGGSVDECKQIIDFKVSEWSRDDKYAKYLVPKTLFRKSHWADYLDESSAGGGRNDGVFQY